MIRILFAGVLLMLGWFIYERQQALQVAKMAPTISAAPISAPATAMLAPQSITNRSPQALVPANEPSQFHCDGRQYCSEMNSLEEARYFLQHCPGTQMDGDLDGHPCEQKFGHN